jgi:hypothetical protein
MFFAANLVVDSAIAPIVEVTAPIISKLNVLVGGIFGLYLILIVARIYYERRKVKILEDIRYDLDNLNYVMGTCYSPHRKEIMKVVANFLRRSVGIKPKRYLCVDEHELPTKKNPSKRKVKKKSKTLKK